MYDEGVHIGWRALQGRPVAFEFGAGLSYTSFTYAWSAPPVLGADGVVRMAVAVTNAGDVAGADVPQLYLRFPAAARQPPLVLRGFAKTGLLAAGADVNAEDKYGHTALWYANFQEKYEIFDLLEAAGATE